MVWGLKPGRLWLLEVFRAHLLGVFKVFTWLCGHRTQNLGVSTVKSLCTVRGNKVLNDHGNGQRLPGRGGGGGGGARLKRFPCPLLRVA